MTDTKILICGEAWGAEEERQKKPFVGASGWYLNNLLEEAKILPIGSAQIISQQRYRRDEIYHNAGVKLTNVFNLRPEGNKIDRLCGPQWGGNLPSLSSGKYLRADFLPELERLASEVLLWKPNIILGLGATALWFFTGTTTISKQRGTVAESKYGKFLATYHPAHLMRGMDHLRPIVLFDLMKTKRQAEFPEIRRPQRFVHIPESIDDIHEAIKLMKDCERISIDIETREDIITCIGFAWTPKDVLVIPLLDYRRPDNAYWNHNEEKEVWALIKHLCQMPQPKVFQNGLYDLHFLWRRCGIPVSNCADDTMLLHHSLQPEVQKGLGFLGSIYCDEPAWKTMRGRGRGTIKHEDE
jgi:uracil-DNA glycosylase